MTDEACETCRFWQRDDELYKGCGRCRRLPPVARERRWPVAYAHEWCGEWRPAAVELPRVEGDR